MIQLDRRTALKTMMMLGAASAIAARPGDWTDPVEVRHEETLCLSYRARWDGPLLVVQATIEPGWHTFAMDNKLRAEEKLAGKKSLGIDHPTEIKLTRATAVEGPGIKLRPKISPGPSYAGSVGASSARRCSQRKSAVQARQRRRLRCGVRRAPTRSARISTSQFHSRRP